MDDIYKQSLSDPDFVNEWNEYLMDRDSGVSDWELGTTRAKKSNTVPITPQERYVPVSSTEMPYNYSNELNPAIRQANVGHTKDAVPTDYKKKVEALTTYNKTLTEQLKERDEELRDLKWLNAAKDDPRKIEQLTDACNRLSMQNHEMNDTILKLQDRVTRLQEENHMLSSRLSRKPLLLLGATCLVAGIIVGFVLCILASKLW